MSSQTTEPFSVQCRVITETRDRVGESPVWSVTEQALYWVDIEGRRIHRWDSAAGTVQSWHSPERVGCIVLSARGGLVAAMESGVFEVTLLAPPALRACLPGRSQALPLAVPGRPGPARPSRHLRGFNHFTSPRGFQVTIPRGIHNSYNFL